MDFEELHALIGNYVDGKRVGEVIGVLLSLCISAGMQAEMSQEELEEFMARAVDEAYGALTPSGSIH